MNTSNHWLINAAQKHQPQVIALQEVWTPNDDINIPGYKLASKWYRKKKDNDKVTGGGVAIFCTGDAKVVDLTEFQVENLEACWADIMVNGERLVFGSVYINVGKINEIEILEKVMTKILASHKKILVCLDANSRSLQWDPSCINRERSSMVRKMGERFEELSLELSMDVLNNGQLTYHSGEHATAVDITLAHGIQSTEKMKWYTIDDMLQTPHKGIIIEFGNKKEFKK